jgi:hypothetical protein
MRRTVTLDETLLARASELTLIGTRSALLREALVALIERESAPSLSARRLRS